ncbi:MAG: precorrin-6Y C5,15-methyltransferase (decarboxylating) subunit CbiT, partial [Nitrososphaera sp.]
MLWDYRTPGIPDELFERTEDVPITKEDVRALAVSKLRLKERFSAIDVGCGSGSITVELCLQTRGKVYGIDFDKNAVELTKKNLLKFGVDAEIALGKAQDILPTLPEVDAIVVGGTWGDARQVIQLAVGRLKKGGRIVIDTILIETMYQALTTVNELQLIDVD